MPIRSISMSLQSVNKGCQPSNLRVICIMDFYKIVILLLVMCSPCFGQDLEGLQFIQNKNQWEEGVDFRAKVSGGFVDVSAKGFSVFLIDQEKLDQEHQDHHDGISEATGQRVTEPTKGHYFKINFLGANWNAKFHSSKHFSGYYNYFLGSDTCRWASDVRAFGNIIYEEIYTGIDLHVSSLGQNLKYDFIVKPEADPDQIKIDYCGMDGMDMNNGDIVIHTSIGELTEKKPFTFQEEENGKNKVVNSAYDLLGSTASFSFPDGFDECRELVIDPLLIFSTYSGSTADNWGSTATPGEHGSLYSSGIVNHWGSDTVNLPVTTGAFQITYGGSYDIAILKYDSAGTKFLYATYLGGSGNETPHSLLMDSATQDLIVLGTSSSSNYPTSATAYDRSFNFGQPISTHVIPYGSGSDIVLSRISKNGNQLKASTFIGGNLNDGLNVPTFSGGQLATNYGDEMRGDVITDAQGNIYLSSVTSSTNFPVTTGFGNTYRGGGSDAVVMKLSADLSSIIWSGFLGGSFYDAAYSIKFDKEKNVLVAGGTNSPDFPVTSGAYQTILGGGVDGWITRLSSDGNSVLQSTFTGTTSYDQVYFVDLNEAGEIFCYGQTSGAMPVTSDVYNNPNSGQFLQKFSADLSTLGFSTVFGSGIGIPNISPTAFLVNDCDNIFLSGWGGDINRGIGYWNSTTVGMPITADAFQKTTQGSDFYFMVLNSNATELLYSTFLGGSDSKTHVDGGTSRFDKYGIVYHAVCAGCASLNDTGKPTSDFPTTKGALSRLNKSNNCNNAAFKFDLASLRARFQTNTVDFDSPGINQACFPDSIRFSNTSTGGETYMWDFDDGTIITKPKTDTTSIVHQFMEEGVYRVKLKAIDDNTCIGVDSTIKVIRYYDPQFKVSHDSALCFGSSIQLMASGGETYQWHSEDNTFESSLASPIVQPVEDEIYFLSVMDANGCSHLDTVNIDVIAGVDVNMEYEFSTDCLSRPSIHVINTSLIKEDETYLFDFGDGSTSTETNVVHSYERDSLYRVKLVGKREFCSYEKSFEIPIFSLFVPNVFTPNGSKDKNDTFIIGFGDSGKIPADEGIIVSLSVVDRWGKQVYESSDYRNDWKGDNIEGGIYFMEMKFGNLGKCRTWLHIIK